MNWLPFFFKKQFNELLLLTDVGIHGLIIPQLPENLIPNLTESAGYEPQGGKVGSTEPSKGEESELGRDELDHCSEINSEKPSESPRGRRNTHGCD